MNRQVLITGAAGGIGQALVSEFLSRGCSIGLHYRSNASEAERLQAQNPERITLHQADLTQEHQVAQIFDRYSYDTLIANAGFYESRSSLISEMSLEQWESTFSSNVRTTFLTVKHFVRSVVRRGLHDCSIVLVGSTAAEFGEAGHSDYAASKAALRGILLSVKNELGRLCSGGRINMVSPAWTVTPMAEEFLKDEAAVKRALQTKALPRLVRADDVAKAAAFLADPQQSGQITGMNLVVTGGMEGRVLWKPSELDISKV